MLTNRVVIITGASSGIGEATAIAFSQQGCRVVLAARSIAKLNEVVKPACMAAGAADVLTVACDVSDVIQCQSLIDQTISRFGTIHVLINNAGISMRALFNEADLSVIHQVMQVNFMGMVYCTKFALPYLLKEKGSVVAVSSVSGFKGLPGRTAYAASKFAMQGFMESLRIENQYSGLHVGIICPGYTSSNIRKVALVKDASIQRKSPLDEKKLMRPDTVADAIVDMVIKRKRFKVLTQLGKWTFFLNKFFPVWVDKQIFNVVSKEPDSPFKAN